MFEFHRCLYEYASSSQRYSILNWNVRAKFGPMHVFRRAPSYSHWGRETSRRCPTSIVWSYIHKPIIELQTNDVRNTLRIKVKLDSLIYRLSRAEIYDTSLKPAYSAPLLLNSQHLALVAYSWTVRRRDNRFVQHNAPMSVLQQHTQAQPCTIFDYSSVKLVVKARQRCNGKDQLLFLWERANFAPLQSRNYLTNQY